MRALLSLFLFVISLNVAAAPDVIARLKGWTVIKRTDTMTDKVSCGAVNAKHGNVVLSKDRIVVSMFTQGGIAASMYRFDKDRATDFVSPLPSDGSNMWWMGDMERLANSNRLQVRIKPILGNFLDFDIDLSEVRKVLEIMESDKCM